MDKKQMQLTRLLLVATWLLALLGFVRDLYVLNDPTVQLARLW
jgi:hypothetical protein